PAGPGSAGAAPSLPAWCARAGMMFPTAWFFPPLGRRSAVIAFQQFDNALEVGRVEVVVLAAAVAVYAVLDQLEARRLGAGDTGFGVPDLERDVVDALAVLVQKAAPGGR